MVFGNFLASHLEEKHGIEDEQKELQECLLKLEGALQSQPYLSPSTDAPGLGDLSVFGTLRALDGLPIQSVVNEGKPALLSWYDRMTEQTHNPNRPPIKSQKKRQETSTT